MTEFAVRSAAEADFSLLAQLRIDFAEDDRFDSLSTMESLPSAVDLRDLADRSAYFCVALADEHIAGYGFLRWWDEDSGTRVILCDWYLAAPFKELNLPLLAHLESQALKLEFDHETKLRSVIGTNASSVQTDRAAVIENSGYTQTFAQIEMELLDADLSPGSLPSGLEVRNAVVEDAQALIELTRRVWAVRDFFSMPTVDKFDGWLRRSDLSLFDVVISNGEIVAFVASIPHGNAAEIDDVQVDPRFQRMGIASALITRNLERLRARGFNAVRLNTEGHDPAGARSLYEKLGFQVVRSYLRYRKPLTSISANV